MSRVSCSQDFLQDRTAGPNCSGPAKIHAALQDPEQDQQKTLIFVFFSRYFDESAVYYTTGIVFNKNIFRKVAITTSPI